MAYSNGRLPDSALGYISGTNERLTKDLVPQTNALRSAFQAHFGKPLVITDAYRDYATQVRLRAQKGKFAAVPGTSNHGWGRAIDFGSRVNIENSAEYNWMRANAPRFGWTHPLWARDNNPYNGQQEPWHWEAVVVPVSNYTNIPGVNIPNPGVTTPDPISQEEDEDVAKIIKRGAEPGIFLSAPALGVHYHIPTGEEVNELSAYYGPVQTLGARQFDVRRQAALNVQNAQNNAVGSAVVNTKVGDTGTLAQTTRDTRVIARRSEAPIAETKAELGRIGTRLKEISAAPSKVRHWYRTLLGREATPAEVDLRTAQITDGQTLDQHYAGIKNSPEAVAYAKKKAAEAAAGKK